MKKREKKKEKEEIDSSCMGYLRDYHDSISVVPPFNPYNRSEGINIKDLLSEEELKYREKNKKDQ